MNVALILTLFWKIVYTFKKLRMMKAMDPGEFDELTCV